MLDVREGDVQVEIHWVATVHPGEKFGSLDLRLNISARGRASEQSKYSLRKPLNRLV